MAALLGDIEEWFQQGVGTTDSHMIVMMDSFDYEDYPIYTPAGQDPRKFVPTNGDRVMECYDLSMPWSVQSAEHRANHWEWK